MDLPLVSEATSASKDKDKEKDKDKDKDKEKPFALSHHALSLRVDFAERRIDGIATLSLAASSISAVPEVVKLQCRQASIQSVKVNGIESTFNHIDPVAAIASKLAQKQTSASNHPEFRALYIKSLEQSDEEGELIINIPKSLRNQPTIKQESTETSLNSDSSSNSPGFISVTIQIEYELVDPKLGIHFVFPDQGISSAKTPYLYTSNEGKSARYWTPCFDNHQQKAPWTIEFLTPASFASPADFASIKKTSKRLAAMAAHEVIAQSNGTLVDCFLDPAEEGWKVTRYTFESVSVCASSILLAVGAFGYFSFGQTVITDSAIPADGQPSAAGAPTVEVPDEDEKEDEDKSDDEDDEKKEEKDKDGGLVKNMAAVTSSTINGTTIRGVKCEAFFPNGLKEEVRETVEFLSQAMEFYEQFTGLSFPFPSYKLVFVHDAVNSVIIGAGVVIVSTHLLLDEDDIENVFDSRFRFAVMLASQWFGQYVTHRNWTDNWLTLGLANYMASLFIKKLLGNNEYRYRLSEDMKRVAAMDVGQLPLCPAFLLTEDTGGNTEDPLIAKYFSPSDEPDSLRTEFLSLKSPLVIGMLDQRLGKGNLLKVINKIMISTMSGELENGLSTNHFFKVCRKISASAELKSFADQWIFGSGCPIFRLAFKFNRKKLVVEVTMLQENTNRNHPTATKKFTGPFTVRVHEPKGIAYSHQIFIDEMEKVVELPYHTKYKRAGQKLKKLQKLGIVTGPETEQAEEEDEFQQEFSSAAPVGSEPAPKDKSKPDLDQLDRRSLEWIRWDPDGDWLCLKVYDQLRSMWIEQLARDLDVVAHHEAVVRLATMPDNLTTMALMRVLTDERHFYRLRMEAAFSLAKLGLDPHHGSPFPKLVKDFLEKYCYERAVNSVMTIPIPNDFTNFQEYFVKKAICTALVAYRDAEFKIPLQNKRIVLDLLRFNDNSKNKYSDAYYISALINAICHATIPQKFRENQAKPKDANNPTEGVFEEIEFMASAADDPDEEMDLGTEEDRALLSATISEVDRYLALDRLNASHHNIVTRTCIEAKLKWMLAGLIPVDLSFFLNYAGYGNFFLVRMAAIDALLLLDGFSTDELVNYLVQLVEHDPDPRVQYHIAKELYNVAVLIKNVSAEDPKRKKANTVVSSHSWVTVQAKIVKNNVVGDLIWSLLRKSTLDFRIRSYLLRFCEKVYTPVAFQAAVTPRKLVIKMPSLTMNEASEIPSKPLPKQPAAKPPPAPKPPPKAPVFTEPLPPVDPKFLETGRKVIHNLTNHPSAAAFMLPVDESFAPMYFSLIKKPMDISTAAKKLESGAYRNNLTFLFADIQLIFSNCYKYNTDDSPVTKQAQRLEIYFNTQIMPRALVHELNILSNAIDVEEESHSITPTDMMEDVIASPAIPVPVPQPVSVPVSVPVPVEPKVPAPKPAIKLTYKPAPVDKPKDTPPKLTLLPPKPVAPTTAPQNPVTTTATSAIPSEVRHPQSSNVASPPLKPPTVQPPIPKAVAQPPVPKPAVLAQPPVPKPSSQPPIPKPNVFTQPPVPKSSTPAQPPIPKPSAPKVAQPPIPKPALLPPTVPPPLPKPVLKLKPEESETTAPKRKLSVGGGTVVSPNVPSMPVARLESEDYKKCKKILRHLFENEKSFWFHAPVDPIALGIPTYFEVIKEPMDLATLKTLLAEGKVVTVKEFRHKCGLIFKNAMNFNPPNTQVYQDALFLLEMFRTEMKTYFSGGSDTKAVGAAVSSRPQPVAPAPIDAFKASVQTQEPVIKKLKLKHDKGPEVGQPASFPPKAVPSPMVPIAAAPTHSQPSFSSSGSERMLISSVAGKKCQKVLKKLQASNFGAIFLAPVDPVALKIPEYFNVIKRPMDLGTIQKRLEKGQYRDHLAFKADVELVLNNCFTFNVPGDWVYNQGKGLEGVFHKEWKDIDWDIIPIPGQARPVGPTIEKTLEKLRSHPNGFIFLEPVDPTILPDYYTRIRNPIDLRTMGEKLQRGEYQTLDAFEKDIKLMFANCFTYNEKESLGHNSGLALEKYFKSIFVKGK